MTKKKPISELKRPRRLLGGALRANLRCPLCGYQPLRVVAYRAKTVRLECPACELRFSVPILGFAMAMVRNPKLVVAGDPEKWAAIAVALDLMDDDSEKSLERIAEVIADGGVRALEGHLQAEGRWDAWVAKLAELEEKEGGEDA